MTAITLKLAFAGLMARRLPGLLSVLVIGAASAALTIALAVGTVADRPFDRTFDAMNGAHVTVSAPPGGPALDRLAELPGVVASTGLVSVAWTSFDRADKRYGLRLVSLSRGPAHVSRPLLVNGSWPGPGEVVLEQSFARFHHFGPGATLETPGGRLVVSGVAVMGAGEAYPQAQPGVGLARITTIARVVPDRSRWAHAIGLRLADPGSTDAIATRVHVLLGERAFVDTWLDDREAASEATRVVSIIISIFGALLLLTAGAVLATLVGGRVVAQSREIGTLKAAGVTPGQITRVLVVEQLGLGVLGVVIGLLAGSVMTPVFTTPAASLLNASQTPAFDPVHAAIVALATLGLVAIFALVPALHAARKTTVTVLNGGRPGATTHSRLGRVADRLGMPPSIGVGARGAFVRRGRTLLTAFALAVTVASAVATLGMEASLDVATDPGVAPAIAGLDTPVFDPVNDDAGEEDILRPVVYSLDALLLFIGLVNLLATLLLTGRERRRDFGMLKAVGLTPRQVTGSLVSEQIVVGLLAGAVGLPLGLALFRLSVELTGGAGEFAYPSWWSLALLVPGIVAVVAALTAPVARRAASGTVADALRFE